MEGLATALLGFQQALQSPTLCSNDLDGALSELKQLQLSLQHQCAADYHCRRSSILRNHVVSGCLCCLNAICCFPGGVFVLLHLSMRLLLLLFAVDAAESNPGVYAAVYVQLNPNHRANRSHQMGLEFLHALRAAQWRSHDLGAWHQRQKQQRRQQHDLHRQQSSLRFASSLHLTRQAPLENTKDQQQTQEGGRPKGSMPLGGFKNPRLVYVDEIGADVLAPDVDIGASAAIWRKYYYVPNAMKLVVVGPAAPAELLRVVQQAFGPLQANHMLRPFECRHTKASDIEALNPQPLPIVPHWYSLGAAEQAAAQDGSGESSRVASGSGRRHRVAPAACPHPRQLIETDREAAQHSAAPLGTTSAEPVARLKDLSRLVMMLPANRQSHTIEFAFVFENEGSRRPPCKNSR